MKVTVEEYDGCFSISLVPENLSDATTLIRLGMNALKEVRSISATAYRDSGISASVVIAKSKRSAASVRRGSW